GKSSVTPWSNANTRAWKTDIVSYDAGMASRPVVVFAGGVGAARFLRGLVRVVPPDEIVVIGNTGDDMWWHGLYIAPDLDTVTYWLAGVADEVRGWGIRGDTFTAQATLAKLTDAAWFQLGDRDLATHLYRTGRLTSGASLHTVTAELAEQLGVRSRILPMCDEPVETRLKTDAGDLHFQEYFVRAEGIRPDALGVAEVYRDVARGFVLDSADASLAPAIAALGYRMAVLPTMLDDTVAAGDVARAALDVLQQPAAA